MILLFLRLQKGDYMGSLIFMYIIFTAALMDFYKILPCKRDLLLWCAVDLASGLFLCYFLNIQGQKFLSVIILLSVALGLLFLLLPIIKKDRTGGGQNWQ